MRRRLTLKLSLLLTLSFLGGMLFAQSVALPGQAVDAPKPGDAPPPPVADSDRKPPVEPAKSPSIAGDSTALEPIKKEKAIYSYEAREKKLQGEVVVRIVVSETGDVEKAELVSGDPILGQSAMDAFKKWKFKPFIKNGKAVKVSTKLPMDFAFSDKIMDKGVSADRTTTSSPDVPPKMVQVSSAVIQGMLIRQVAPVYPDAARQARIEGTVVLAAMITKEGTVGDLQVVSGPKILVPAAIGAVQQWRYRPYQLMGEPVQVKTQIQVNFQLR